MPAYDYDTNYKPPLPTSEIEISAALPDQIIKDGRKIGPAVIMLLDTGADRSIIPKNTIRQLESKLRLKLPYDRVEVQDFDGNSIWKPSYELTISSKIDCFNYRKPIVFIETNEKHGILGRDVLNKCSLCFDGPALKWQVKKMSFKDFLQRIFSWIP